MRSAVASKARPRPGRAARPANPETLTEQAYRQLEEQIVTLRLKPGEFELYGWPAALLFALVVAYFYVGRRVAGGTLWDRFFGIGRPQPR